MSVKFGFSESTVPDFQANSWAAMRRADDGSASLSTGKLVSEPKRVVVSLEKDGRVFGRSFLPRPPAEDAPVEERVREARNTILAQELWHEINREGRTLLAYNVRLRPDSVVYTLDDHTTIAFTLVSVSEEPDVAPAGLSHTGDAYAETICVGLYLLLAYAHRQSAKKRTHLVPLSVEEGIAAKPPYNLIRPAISYLQHEMSLRSTIQFLAGLTGLLRAAGIQEAGYTVQEHVFPALPIETGSEGLLALILSPLRYRIELTLTRRARLEIVGVGHVVSSQQGSSSYRVTLLPAASAGPQSDTPPDRNPHPLSYLYPPAGDYPTREETFDYLRAATLRVLANHCEVLAKRWTSEARQHDEAYNTTWITNLMGDGLHDRETERRGVIFELVYASNKTDAAPLVTELKVKGDQLSDNGRLSRRVWSWKAEDLNEKDKGVDTDTLQDVVHHVLMGLGTVAASHASRDT
jgi:mediator of RNA polymerase II transcription subunit 17